MRNNYKGELKNPFENKNKLMSNKGPTPNTNRTIFAVLGVVFVSTADSLILVFNFLFDFCLDITENKLKNHNSNYNLQKIED